MDGQRSICERDETKSCKQGMCTCTGGGELQVPAVHSSANSEHETRKNPQFTCIVSQLITTSE